MDAGDSQSSWLTATSDAFQVLVGFLSGYLALERVRQAFERISEPRNQAERMFLRCFVAELIVDVYQFGQPVARYDRLESILRAWRSIRRHPRPVSALLEALDVEAHPASRHEWTLAEEIHDLLELRYAERLRLQDLADALCVSQPKMTRCFRRVYGSSIHQHLMLVRVRHGLNLVMKHVKVEAAALAVGFRSKKDFYRAVQRFVGCTPAQFRSRHAELGADSR